jgi:hypothetical protein
MSGGHRALDREEHTMDRYELMDMVIEARRVAALDAGYHWDDDENVAYDDNGEIVEF